MATLGDIITEIADDIDDTTGEYTAQTRRSVLEAIRYCERQTYYFNETRDATLTTVVGQTWYTSADLEAIATAVRIQEIYYIDSSGNYRPLIRVPPEELELLADNTGSQGEPSNWAYFQQQVRIYPIPNDAYSLRFQLGPYRLTPLTSDTDTNAWLSEARDLIKARAKYILGKNTLKDPVLVGEAQLDYQDQDNRLTAESSSRMGTGYIQPSDF